MRRLTRSALISLVLASSVATVPLQSAESKDYYTRKRINGRWVEGFFPKKHTRTLGEREVPAAGQPQQSAEPAKTTTLASILPFTLGLHFTQQKPVEAASVGAQAATQPGQEPEEVTTGSTLKAPIVNRSRVERRALRQAERGERRAKRREFQAIGAVSHRPEQVESHRASADSRRRLVAEQIDSAAVKRADAPSARPNMSDATRVADHYKRLGEVLAAKAEALAAGLITSVNQPLPAPGAEPVSVTYDYRTGIKTIAYASGALEEQPFNLAAVRSLSGAPGMQ